MTVSGKDFWTGLIYIFFGSSAILIARGYGMGTAIKMGPAYLPSILGGLLIIIGIISLIRSILKTANPHHRNYDQGIDFGCRFHSPVRAPGARGRVGYRFADFGPCQRLGQQGFSMDSIHTYGRGTDLVLHHCLSERVGDTAADTRFLVRRITRSLFQKGASSWNL